MSALRSKQEAFNQAMFQFENHGRYRLFGYAAAGVSIFLQITTVLWVIQVEWSALELILSLLVAYYLTDLFNGLIHLFMDHYDKYDRPWGPLVAHFHLHHQTPRYTKRPLVVIYFMETAAKLWLPVYLGGLWFLLGAGVLTGPPALVAVMFGVLSSFAEVSHYLCHTSTSKWVRHLGRLRIILPMKHHGKHHSQDNMNYAFLNGMSDPLLNWIARYGYPGYKRTTDLHFANYSAGEQASDRI